MVSFIRKLLELCRPYRQRLLLGVVMGLLAGWLEPLMLLSVKFAVDVAFPGAGTMSSASSAFTTGNIADLPAFAEKLKLQRDEPSKFLWDGLSPATREKLLAYSGTNPPLFLVDSLLNDLNRIILEPSLSTQAPFARVKPSEEASLLLAQSPTNVDTIRLNRALVESAYPDELTQTPPSFIEKHPWVGKYTERVVGWLPKFGKTSRGLDVSLAILAIPFMMLLRGVTSYMNVYFLQWVSVRAVTDLRTKLFAHLLDMPLGFLSKVSTGELLSRVVNDTNALQNSISNSLVVMIKDPATLIGLLVFLLCKQPMLMGISLIVFPVCLVPIIIYSRKVRRSSAEIQTEYAQLVKIMHESFTGSRIIKAYNLESNAKSQFEAASSRFVSHYMRATRAGELPGPLIEFFGAIGVACLFYYIVFSHQHFTAGDFLFFVGCVFSMYRPFKSLSRLYSQMEQANAASERVFELLATVSTLPEPKSPVPLKATGAEIQFDNISFNYDEKPVLRDFNLTVKPGQMVALVGKTGSGKTTVTNLLLRFYDPQSGAVRIGGVDIRQAATPDLRSQIAVVTQETLLFDETIRRNIELGRPGATEAEIIAAAKHAHAEEFIKEKPQGYHTLIGEKGVTLSGGEKQRLAIARAILKNAPILILDEATSALDTQTQSAVQAAFDELMQGRTTICIAHRLSTIQQADLIVVLEQGRVVETGRHEELLALNGVYRRLYELDFKPEKKETTE